MVSSVAIFPIKDAKARMARMPALASAVVVNIGAFSKTLHGAEMFVVKFSKLKETETVLMLP